jgi:hypothetical protein
MKLRDYGLYFMLFVIFLQTMPDVLNWKDYLFFFVFIAAGALYGYSDNKK